jgi:beta-mannosidase
MQRKIISLSDGHWRVGQVAQKKFADVNDYAAVSEWLPAQVPGDVRLDLLRAGKISDPFFADNNEASQWIDSCDWWYARALDVQLADDERAFLIFDGIDYQSAVFVDGKQLGRHAGMFSRQVIELPEQPSKIENQKSEIAVRIWGSDALPQLKLNAAQKIWAHLIKPLYRPPEHPFPDRYATLKCQMQFGWDFAPRLRTCGIWDDVSIVVVRSVFIEDVWIKASISNPQSRTANLTARLLLDSNREQNVRAMVTVRGKNFRADEQHFEFDLHLHRGKQAHTLAFDLADVRLWQPWDRGAPNLYELELSLISLSPLRSPHFLDSSSTLFGIRTFELTATQPGTEPWHFIVNGEREFLRGANWVPLDAIPGRLTRDDYATRLHQARDANLNFLRVWGGGMREKRAFYDVCDELGILVWQEFPFAGAILDRFPNHRAHLQHIHAECGDIVRALRNHPSLVVWCGGNEFNTRGNRTIVDELRAVVNTHDGTRPFKPASPYRDESHNWRVWHRFANLRDYRQDRTPFLSEFGLQALPNLESLKKFLPDEALRAPHRLWEYHHADLKKLERYAKNLMAHRNQISEFIDATQRAQTYGLQIAIEHMRRRKSNAAGVALWQFNDAWGAISWSIIDYYGTPKRAYHELKNLYAPVFASFDYALMPRRAGDIIAGTLWLINDWRTAFENVELRAELNGNSIYTRRVALAPDSATPIDALKIKLSDGENILRLIARDDRQIFSDHTYDLNFCDIGEMSLLDRLMVEIGTRLMR